MRLSFLPNDLFSDDLKKASVLENPIIRECDLFVVLSGRSTALGNDADKLGRPFDRQDDAKRLGGAIAAAKKENGLNVNKPAVRIFYNGRKIHNKDLKVALANNSFAYPSHLFIIRDIDPQSTIGQAKSLARFLELEGSHIRNIAVFTSAYHKVRAARTLGLDSLQALNADGTPNALSRVQFFFHGIDQEYAAEGILQDLKGEHQAMVNYSADSKDKPASISRYLSRNVFMNTFDVIVRMSFNLQYWDGIASPNWMMTVYGLTHFRRMKFYTDFKMELFPTVTKKQDTAADPGLVLSPLKGNAL